MAVALPSLFTVKAASLDTQQRLPYNRQRTKPKKPQNPTTLSPTTTTTTTSQTLTLSNTRDSSISALLSRKIQKPIREKLEETYLGYETWLPVAPKVEKPRSIYNAASLAYIGDCIYELYARRHFLFPPLTIEEYNNRVMAVIRTEAQDAMLQKLLTKNYLLEEERDVLRWGKNSGSGWLSLPDKYKASGRDHAEVGFLMCYLTCLLHPFDPTANGKDWVPFSETGYGREQ